MKKRNFYMLNNTQKEILAIRSIIFLLLFMVVNSMQAQDVTFRLINEQVTNAGASWEADVTIESSAGFKLGSGQLYFNYNTAAFGQNVSNNSKLTITHPSGSLLETTLGSPPFQFDYYTQFVESDNTTSRFSYSWQHAFSEACLTENNVTSTASVLFHIQLDYTTGGGSQSSGMCFESSALFDNQIFTACGPNNCNNVDCINFAGTQITNDNFDCSAVLPIELLFFNARLENPKSIIIQWETLSEKDASHFDIERSYGTSNNWENLGKVNAIGSRSAPASYHFRDQKFENNLIYYRLKIWDKNGFFKYSNVEVVNIKPLNKIRLFPNPTSSQLNVEIEMPQSSVVLFSLFDATNRPIWVQKKTSIFGCNSFSFPLEGLTNGVYYLKIEAGRITNFEKFVINR